MKDLYIRYKNALSDSPGPQLFLDYEAFESNLKWALDQCGNKKIRLATKSIRSVEILKDVLHHSPVFQGLMTFTLQEALWLREQGFKDILMGYPCTNREDLQKLIANPDEITLMVDLPEHIDLIEALNPPKKISICLDLDLSYDLPGIRFGVYRSSLRTLEDVKTIIKKIKSSQHINLVGLMGYEAQIAGIADKSSWVMRILKKISIRNLRKKRDQIFKFIAGQGFNLTLVNGGGTGSFFSTREENCITELTLGSGLYAPTLFDHYVDLKLKPALLFTIPIVRKPTAHTITCLGGGYIASGAIEKAKQPSPYLPEGLELLPFEGAGEVQTPLKNSLGHPLKLGDPIIMRHAKAGEICERFDQIRILKGAKIEKAVNTYRGDGKCFL